MGAETELVPIVDPALPHEEAALLRAHPEVLTAAFDEPPPAKPLGGRTRGNAKDAFLSVAAAALLPAVAGYFAGGPAAIAVGTLLQIGLVAVWWTGGLGAGLLAMVVLQVVLFPVFFVTGFGESEQVRLARRHHRRYYVANDFDTEPLESMKRAQRAVNTVLASQVNGAGLLDDIANATTLPQQEWEVAKTLAEVSHVRWDVVEVGRGSAPTERVTEMLTAQHRALDLATEAVEARIAALVDYAERTRAADEAYREWEVVQELAELSVDSRELLARTVRDELAIAEIEGLSEQARLVQEALRRSVEQAREAGLAVPGLTAVAA
ncbi:hypothetical protein [Actinomadura macrotermitis]|uniref:Uncharacterized protein n=1 Tax=Actinomadura macrotermitis TaxID=2585200 RepID=A0A7K0BXJ8_9ACTN|nr:hypothetical protein [Actinomadura macrotermitis]MQY05572.1 hypothetical protein [Actinomadura macrotermitis]